MSYTEGVLEGAAGHQNSGNMNRPLEGSNGIGRNSIPRTRQPGFVCLVLQQAAGVSVGASMPRFPNTRASGCLTRVLVPQIPQSGSGVCSPQARNMEPEHLEGKQDTVFTREIHHRIRIPPIRDTAPQEGIVLSRRSAGIALGG